MILLNCVIMNGDIIMITSGCVVGCWNTIGSQADVYYEC